ncbi:MAG: hypothetical protein E6R03_10605 [Hyphomicrobiaceae bacterium]|nr:MAG: hypothetical protein E6R03_10605 [Hyphomicrobiaceae bacterium]
MIQQLNERISRTLKLKDTTSLSSAEFVEDPQDGYFPIYSIADGGFINGADAGEISSAQSYAEQAADAAADAANILAATELTVAGLPLDKLNGTSAPTLNDDSADGYSIGSKWYDLVNSEAYICLDATIGAAVWAKATLTLDELTSLFATAAQGANADMALLAGEVKAFAFSSPPTGWLECNGAAISRTTYATLFAVIGTTWGSGDGSTTFNIPDFRGEFLRGWDHGRGIDSGRAFATSQSDAFQGHRHTISTGANSSMTSGFMQGNNGASYPNSGDPITDGTNGTPRTANETRPRNKAILYCIKI